MKDKGLAHLMITVPVVGLVDISSPKMSNLPKFLTVSKFLVKCFDGICFK